jgi:hypothetical protein
MLAVVARTFGARRAFGLRSRHVRVTHTLLFIVALAVSPGVCGACARGCPEPGAKHGGCSPRSGVVCAVAATRGHGSCCGTSDGPCDGSLSPGSRSTPAADAADGILSLSGCCGGGPGCDCLLKPRGSDSAVTASTVHVDPRPSSLAVIAMVCFAAQATASIDFRGLPEKPPSRPVRVLYGVWRN